MKFFRFYHYLYFLSYSQMKKWWSFADEDPWVGGISVLSVIVSFHIIFFAYFVERYIRLPLFSWLDKGKYFGFGVLFLLNYLMLVRNGKHSRILEEFAGEATSRILRHAKMLFAYAILFVVLCLAWESIASK